LKRYTLTLILLAQFGTAFAGDPSADSARWNQDAELVTPPALPREDKRAIHPRVGGRYPSVWYSVQQDPEPAIPTNPVWAQDGYLFKYSF
jgi:hypothetical protein